MTRIAWQFVALFIAYTAIILCVQTFYMQKQSETKLQHSAFLIKRAQADLTSNNSTTTQIIIPEQSTTTETPCTVCPEISTRPSWLGCPEPNQTLVTCGMDGRLGNLVWEYLSTWAVALRHQLWPVIRNESLRELNNVFQDLTIPSLEELFKRCPDLGDLNDTIQRGTRYAWSRGGLIRALEAPRNKMIGLSYYTVLTEYVVPYWRQLPPEMRLQQELLFAAKEIIRNITQKFNNGSNSDENQEVQLVGVHIRRTDYAHHMSSVNPNAELANASYFQHAMQWMRDKLSPQRVAFLVLSDDVEWCRENLNASDVFLPGTGNSTSPGLDLAILASCNHTILAYGTFSLTAAMLAQGIGYTIVFNTRNSTHTKVMEFASLLPYWRIMDNDGLEVSADVNYEMTFIG